MKLSVVMPVYNESATLRQIVHRVLSGPLEIELLCVDDGSKDGSRDILSELERQHPQLRALFQPQNQGKGAALRRGIQEPQVILSLFRTQIWNTILLSTGFC